MLRKFILLLFISNLTACAELQQIASQIPQNLPLSNTDIGNGLRQALDQGISKQVSKLTLKDGFFKNELVKIVLPKEIQNIDNSLRKIGLSNLADQGLKMLNRAAEDAVSTATPIFVNAVKNITFADAKKLLLGGNNAATQYLKNSTETELYSKFQPIIKNSFAKVGADKIWKTLITKYNAIPFTNKVTPDLTNYVTNQTLKGVYTMIGIEEQDIRTKISSRGSNLLKRVFALQDKNNTAK